MNKKFTYPLLLLLFAGAIGFVVVRYYSKVQSEYVAFYPLKERKATLAAAPEWASVQSRANNLIRVVRDNPDDLKAAVELATIYIQEARVTGNGEYYNKAALRYLDAVLQREPQHFEALTLKALVQLSQHHFAEALILATKAKEAGPYNAFVYGLLIDGYVEMGDYTAAVAAAEQMISLRPDIRSYSRIGYLREIHGDLDGAIEAMQRAVKAGGVGDEPTSWARVQLGRLYEQAGNLPQAEMHYTITLEQRPLYPYALAGMARIARAKNELPKAISLLQQADTLVQDPVFKEELAQLYIDMGRASEANSLLQQVVADVNAVVEKTKGDENAAHHADDQLAFAYQLLGNHDKALKHALNEYHRRPENIEMNELLAWAYHRNGQPQLALKHVQLARKTGCNNPRLLARAGIIHAKAGRAAEAKQLLDRAFARNPNFADHQLQQEAASLLKTL